MVSTAQWYCKLITNFATKRPLLRELKMMRVRRAAAAGQARLGAHELEMISISQPKLLAKWGDGLRGRLGSCAGN